MSHKSREKDKECRAVEDRRMTDIRAEQAGEEGSVCGDAREESRDVALDRSGDDMVLVSVFDGWVSSGVGKKVKGKVDGQSENLEQKRGNRNQSGQPKYVD